MASTDATETLALEEARRLFEEGLSVIPLGAPGEAPPAWFIRDRCDGNEAVAREKWPKTPRVSWKDFQHRQPTDAELEGWARSWPSCNWALVTGRQINVVDADSPAAVAWIEAGGITRSPRLVRTAKGAHYYYQAADKVPVRNSVNPDGKIDIRGFGGYVVAGGSIHATGAVYTEETIAGWGDTSWGQLPILSEADLLAISAFNGEQRSSNGALSFGGPGNLSFDASKVAPAKDLAEPVEEGGRNNAANRYAGKLIRSGLSLQEIKALVDAQNAENSPPLSQDEINLTIASTVATHLRNHPGAVVSLEPRPVVRPVFMDLFSLVNDPTDPPPYLIHGLFRQGDNVLLAGPPKSMKTFLMQDLLLALAFGRPVLGFEVPQERRVVWIQAEMPAHETQRRARAHPWVQERMREGKPSNLWVTDRLSTLALDARGTEAMIEMIGEAFDGKPPHVLAIDSLSSVYDRDSEDDNAKMQAFLRERLGRFREVFGEDLTLFMNHHTAKMGMATLKQDPFLAVRGASALRGWYSSGMVLHRDADKPESRLRHLHFELRGDQEPASMVLEFRGGVMVPYDTPQVDASGLVQKAAADSFLKIFDYHQRTTGTALHLQRNVPAAYAPKILADLSDAYPTLAGRWTVAEMTRAVHTLLNERGDLELFDGRTMRDKKGAKSTLRRPEKGAGVPPEYPPE